MSAMQSAGQSVQGDVQEDSSMQDDGQKFAGLASLDDLTQGAELDLTLKLEMQRLQGGIQGLQGVMHNFGAKILYNG